MGFFKTDEEKQQIKEEKARKILEKYELENLSSEYTNAVKNINSELAGSGLIEFGNLLAPDTNTSLANHTQFLNAIVQQNWIIIRELNDISNQLQKLNQLSDSLETNNSNLQNENLIKCKVCDKEIPYNEYGTCEECHKIIMNRLANK